MITPRSQNTHLLIPLTIAAEGRTNVVPGVRVPRGYTISPMIAHLPTTSLFYLRVAVGVNVELCQKKTTLLAECYVINSSLFSLHSHPSS